MAAMHGNLNSPDINQIDLARTTRKVMDRIAPFCQMKDASLDQKNYTSSNYSPPPTVPSSAFSSPAISRSASLSGIPTLDETNSGAGAEGPARVISLSPQAQAKLVDRIKTRVVKMATCLDAHIQAGQVAFKMCREGMVLCDEDVRGGGVNEGSKPTAAAVPPGGTPEPAENMEHAPSFKFKTKHKKAAREGEVGTGVQPQDNGWEVDIDPDEADDRGVALPKDDHHKYGTSGHHFLLHHAHQGHDLAKKTEEFFKEIRQEVYKIAAQTKDYNVPVLVPSGPGQPLSVRKNLREIGLDLVSNLSLLDTDFGRKVIGTVAWWQWVIEDLEKGQQSALCPLSKAQAHLAPNGDDELTNDETKEAMKRAYGWWEAAKNGWQAYYDIIATLHIAYHDLLLSSARAWDGTTVVLKTHEEDSESGDNSAATVNARGGKVKVTNGNSETNESGFEVLRTTSSTDGSTAQDRAAKGSKVKGFMMWRTSYTKSGTDEKVITPVKGKMSLRERLANWRARFRLC